MTDFLPTLPYTMKFVLILISGVILLRISGKRSIAQLTVPESVLMIAIGTLLIQPLAPKTEWGAIYGGALLVGGMILIAYIQIWMPRLRKYFYGVPSVLIRNGKVDTKELKKVRMTMDMLEMQLRQEKVKNVVDVKKAVLEPSGRLSVDLIENKKSAEKGDLQILLKEMKIDMAEIKNQLNKLSQQPNTNINTNSTSNVTQYQEDKLFEEADQESQKDNNLKM